MKYFVSLSPKVNEALENHLCLTIRRHDSGEYHAELSHGMVSDGFSRGSTWQEAISNLETALSAHQKPPTQG